MNYSHVSVIAFNALFPSGVSMGTSTSYNLAEIDFDGQANPVIRGTSIAGVLRHRYSEVYGKESAAFLFGEAINRRTGKGSESRIRFHDLHLDTGQGCKYDERTSNAVDRHWGKVSKGSLYSFQLCPPNTSCFFRMEIFEDDPLKLEEETKRIASIISSGLILGGKSNRGCGYLKPPEDIFCSMFNISETDEYSKYLNITRYFREGNRCMSSEYFDPVKVDDTENSMLRLEITFRIPSGQDILIGDGKMQQMKTVGYDGQKKWLLPCSSLRGVLRSFITSYAAKSKKQISYDLEKAPVNNLFSDDHASNVAWLFQKPSEGGKRNPELHDMYPVASLFGSLHAAGRLHVTDSLVSATVPAQVRMHVAVDAVSGGALEGALFSNEVIPSDATAEDGFHTSILVRYPVKDDINFLVASLKAIHSGYLRIGSSKASGRLEVVQIPQSFGNLSSYFDQVWKEFSK